ncbi:MAG TPA: IS1 family transposase [Terriglobia bacterium]|nr:IS1 family transposase [Terriglobia bacterium]
MNKLDRQTRTHVLSCILEGCSIRATVRITGVSKKAVMRLLVEAGNAPSKYQDRVFRNLECRRIQVDELWGFIYCKEKTVTEEIASKNAAASDIWLWVAIDADSKLVPCFMLGNRDSHSANVFIDDLASRLATRVQVTSDGLKCYIEAIEGAFGAAVDYAQLVKLYGASQEETRYSPAECIGCERKRIIGNPDPKHISTSYSERQNWTVRTNMRRYTRLSNGFSRKVENHFAAVALNYFSCNFIKIHSTLRVTPAMAAGVSSRLFDVSDLVSILEETEAERAA